jgi:hypothetical protein
MILKFVVPMSTEVVHSTPNLKIKGLNPATDTGGLYYKHITFVI